MNIRELISTLKHEKNQEREVWVDIVPMTSDPGRKQSYDWHVLKCVDSWELDFPERDNAPLILEVGEESIGQG